jgi:hypothetical protein
MLLQGLINIDLYYIRIYCSTYVRVRTLTNSHQTINIVAQSAALSRLVVSSTLILGAGFQIW